VTGRREVLDEFAGGDSLMSLSRSGYFFSAVGL